MVTNKNKSIIDWELHLLVDVKEFTMDFKLKDFSSAFSTKKIDSDDCGSQSIKDKNNI